MYLTPQSCKKHLQCNKPFKGVTEWFTSMDLGAFKSTGPITEGRWILFEPNFATKTTPKCVPWLWWHLTLLGLNSISHWIKIYMTRLIFCANIDTFIPYIFCIPLLSDFINLTQVHNFTVSAQDIFTFRRLSVFTVSFTRILQVLMQIIETFCTVLLTSQVVFVLSLQTKGPEFEST